MEAARHLTPESEPSVRAIGNRLVIESLQIEDETAARVTRERAEGGQPADESVGKMVEIGARVLDREETAADVDYVRRELEKGLGELDVRLQGTLEEGGESLLEAITDAFGPERANSVQQQIKEIVGRAGEEQREALQRIFTSEDGSNPLLAFQARLSKALSESDSRHREEIGKLREGHTEAERKMRDQVAALEKQIARLMEKEDADRRVAEAEEAGTRKGRTFEERVHLALEALAQGRGDAAHHVGDEAGAGGSKKGDTVIEVEGCAGPPVGRIVFEDKVDKLSKNDAWKELNSAREERDADFAVLVVAGEENVPSGREQLVEYQGDKMIVAVDPDQPDGLGLDLAYRYARLRVKLKQEAELTLDAPAVRDAAEEAAAALKSAQSIRLALTSIEKSTGKARTGLDSMVADVEAKLARIEALIEAAE